MPNTPESSALRLTFALASVSCLVPILLTWLAPDDPPADPSRGPAPHLHSTAPADNPRDTTPHAPRSPDDRALSTPAPLDVEAPSLLIPPSPLPNDPTHFFKLTHPALGPQMRLPTLEITLGAPGLYPPLALTADARGELAAALDQSPLLDGSSSDEIELLVRDTSRTGRPALAMWRAMSLSELRDVACEMAEQCKELPLFDAQPLSVAVRSPEGAPIAGATVRLGREVVGLIQLEQQSDEAGIARFGALPEGEYALVVEARGFLDEQRTLSHSATLLPDEQEEDALPTTHQVELQKGRALYGRVVDARGEGVVGAFVTAYVDRYGEPDVLPVESFMRIDSLPIKGIATTAEDGYFSLSGLPRGVAYVTAMGTLGVPALSTGLELRDTAEIGPIELQLHGGADVEVLVTGPDGPLPRALVQWHDPLNGLQSRFVTAQDGIALFENVPPDALFTASLESWSSPRMSLEAPDEDGVYRLDMTLEPPGSRRDLSLRLLTPTRTTVSPARVSFRSDRGALCQGQRREERDWNFSDCKAEAGWLRVETVEHGVFSTPITLEPGLVIELPTPPQVEVLLEGWAASAEEAARLHLTWRDELDQEHAAPLEVFDRRETRFIWRASLYPGRYELSLVADATIHTRPLEVVDSPTPHRQLWTRRSSTSLDVSLVDERAHSLYQSYLFWLVDGIVKGERADGARHRVELSEEELERVVLVACGAQAGCAAHRPSRAEIELGSVRLDVASAPLTRLELSEMVSSSSQAEQLLGAALVRDNHRYLIDVKGEQNTAAYSHIARGSTLHLLFRPTPLSAWRALVRSPEGAWGLVSLKGT